VEYLWANIPDLTMLKPLPPLGNPAMLLFSSKFGDNLVGSVIHPDRLDDAFLVFETTEERAGILRDALELIGNKKIGRKIRTRITKGKPRTPPWKWI